MEYGQLDKRVPLFPRMIVCKAHQSQDIQMLTMVIVGRVVVWGDVMIRPGLERYEFLEKKVQPEIAN